MEELFLEASLGHVENLSLFFGGFGLNTLPYTIFCNVRNDLAPLKPLLYAPVNKVIEVKDIPKLR